jgi:hypothetical protein
VGDLHADADVSAGILVKTAIAMDFREAAQVLSAFRPSR